MKLSTKGRYGLRAMIDIAVNSDGSHVSLSSIAERQNISENYLEQAFSTLRKSGLVKSIKGAQGGYVLGDKPANIKVGAILRALEGDLSLVDVNEIQEDNIVQICIMNNVWQPINNKVNELVDSLTLEGMVLEYRKLNGSSADEYYI